MLGCGSGCRASVWGELAGNARIRHLQPVLGSRLMQYHKERVKKEVLKGKTNSRDQILSLLDLAGRGQCERSVWVLDPEFGRWGGGEAVPVPGSWE